MENKIERQPPRSGSGVAMAREDNRGLPADLTMPVITKWMQELERRTESFAKPGQTAAEVKQEMEAQLLIVQLVERLSSATKG